MTSRLRDSTRSTGLQVGDGLLIHGSLMLTRLTRANVSGRLERGQHGSPLTPSA